jgi:hypothetical protein
MMAMCRELTLFSIKFGSNSFWWGEATDEPPPFYFGAPRPAREDARPTDGKLRHHLRFQQRKAYTLPMGVEFL